MLLFRVEPISDVLSQKEGTKMTENRQAKCLQITLGETSEFNTEMKKEVFIVEADSRCYVAVFGIKILMDVLIDNSGYSSRKRFDLKEVYVNCKKM